MEYTSEEIEKMAEDALKEIHQHTTLCVNENEEHIFLCGFNAGIRNKVKEFSSKPLVISSVCSHEGCELPATCNGKCGGHCDCLAG